MSKRDEALASLAAIKARVNAPGADLSPAVVTAMFGDLIKTIETLRTEAPAPAAGSKKLDYVGFGDPAEQQAEMVANLPKDVQRGIDTAYIAAKILRKPVGATKSWNRLVEGSSELQKAIAATSAGSGSDWVPTQFSAELIAEVTQLAGVEGLHPHIPMPTNPFNLPLQLGRLKGYKVSEQTADSGQTAGRKSTAAGVTGNLSLSAKGIQAEVLTSKNAEEDSIVAIMPFLKMEITKALARAIESAVINGDDSATHQDADTAAGTSDLAEKLWKGYRKLAIANSYAIDFAAAGNAWNIETFLKVRAKLGKYGINPADLAWVVSLQTFFKMLSLKDSGNNPVVMTLDRMGPQATIITGQLGSFMGSPVVVSEFMRDDLNSVGANDAVAANNTFGAIACVHRPGMVFGDRRDATMQVLGELYAEYQQDALLVTLRKDFQPLRPIASNACVAVGYDIALT